MRFQIPFFILALLLVGISSCRKDKAVNPVPYDASLEVYFGDWEFTEKHTYADWLWVPDSVGGHYEEFDGMDTVTTTGHVSMGLKMGEIRIDWDKNSAIGYYATVDDFGNLTCTKDCDNISYADGNIPGSGHSISDSIYYLDLGGISSGSSSDHWEKSGKKL